VTQRKNVSDATAKLIDEEIRRIVEEGEVTARKVLTEHVDELHALAKGLLEYETLSGEECRKIIAGEEITRDTGTDDSPRPMPRRSSIPPAGGIRKEKPTGGLEPEPQPNA
jgi:cell division protease FtsH